MKINATSLTKGHSTTERCSRVVLTVSEGDGKDWEAQLLTMLYQTLAGVNIKDPDMSQDRVFRHLRRYVKNKKSFDKT